MKKVVIHKPGGYRELLIEEHPDPQPAADEVLLGVQAAGVNFADCFTRMGLYASAKHYVGYPITPGFEVAGTVIGTGSDIDDLAPGTAVLAVTRFNGYANRLIVPRQQVFRLPATLTPVEAAGVPAAAMVAPIIPALNDHEIEPILGAASVAGATEAGYVLLRLPLEVRDIFREWLLSEMPDRATHVLSLMRSMQGGKDYDATWGRRQKGTGPYAWSIGRRFEIACSRLKLIKRKLQLNAELFKRPPQPGEQLTLL